MSRRMRSDDWGFPRWRSYGGERAATTVRTCDREGCELPGDRPAPKAPDSPERWWFCEAHAADYNRGWNYFAGLSDEEAGSRQADDARARSGFRRSAHWSWGGPDDGAGDGGRSREELSALAVLELDRDAGASEIKLAYRRLAKAHHPDRNPDDERAAARFHSVQTAYDVLCRAGARRKAG